jgi:L-fuconate dehydratase
LLDANQVWDVPQAIDWTKELAAFNPLWIEEPTSPDDIVGHATIRRAIAPIGVATGEHAHNRVMFKQLLQLEALDFCQIDACRVASINELVPILLLAAKHGIPVCPHAGGVGLSEYVQHLAAFDYIAVSASVNRRIVEYVDHVQEHVTDAATIINGRYQIPTTPGYGTQLRQTSISRYRYPDGEYWKTQ